MSTPSLLNVPYRLKAGTLYSQIPETGAGDFTVARVTSPTTNRSTRVNSLGFIELVNDNVARLDYPLGGAVNGCPALLVEPVAINSALQSENFTTTWSVSNATPTANQATSPDNTLTADRISITSNGGYIRQLLATSNSLTYTLSCFVKNDAVASGDTFRLYFNNNVGGGNAAVANATININAGTVSAGSSGAGVSSVSASIENYGNGWYRVRLTFTLGASAGNASSEIGFEAPTATRTFFAWGAQLEIGSAVTSYIPTTTQAITRGEDLIQRLNVPSLIGQTEGTFYYEGEANFASSDLPFLNRSVTNAILLAKNVSNQLAVYVYYGGVFLPVFATPSAITGPFKIAVGYKQGSPGDTAVFVNGVQVGTTNTTSWAFTGALNNVIVRTDGYIGGAKPYKVRALGVYPNRLSNSELIALTTP